MQRRDFIKTIGAAALAPLAIERSLAAGPAAGYDRVLILIELKGGNDGLNTVVPYADAEYYSLRPRIAIARDQVLQLDARSGLHPALQSIMPLWQSRELAVVQSVGYPGANLSHFRSIEIWDTASKSDEYLTDGWLARSFAAAPTPRSFAADGVIIGGGGMGPLSGTGVRAISLNSTDQFQRQARLANPASVGGNAALGHILKVEENIVQAANGLRGNQVFRTEFPRGEFGNAVNAASQVIASRSGAAVVKLSLGSFDTHSSQPATQQRLLKELGDGIAALKSALTEIGRWESSLIMTYAEFGRRPRENLSSGTDHGTANAHFIAGGAVKGGLYGLPPNLRALDGNGNMPFAVDFRMLYATAMEKWWGLDSSRALAGRFETLDLLRA